MAVTDPMRASAGANRGDSPPQSTSSAISGEMTRLYKERFGRGPTRTQTSWAGPDVVLVTLEQTFTPAERRLVELDRHEQVRELRLLVQQAAGDRFCESIERITGRKVRAFISGVDTRSDVASEIFVLHPAGYHGPSRVAAGPRP
jgi:uncharacterized protein YbcI